jgi:hypothetical protein
MKSSLVVGILLLAFSSISLLSSGKKEQQPFSYSYDERGKTLKKERAEALSEITIQLEGMRLTDFVNIRPTGKKGISVSVMGFLKSEQQVCQTCPSSMTMPVAGTIIPDAALDVSENGVRFVRQGLTHDGILLDIEIKSGTQVKVLADGETILSATMKEPMAWVNKEWREGSDDFNKAKLYGRLPLMPGGLTARKIDVKNYPILSISKVHIVNEPILPGLPGQFIQVAIQVNKMGHVVDVIPLSSTELGKDLEKGIRSYRFSPYLIDGQPSAFTVILQKKFD